MTGDAVVGAGTFMVIGSLVVTLVDLSSDSDICSVTDTDALNGIRFKQLVSAGSGSCMAGVVSWVFGAGVFWVVLRAGWIRWKAEGVTEREVGALNLGMRTWLGIGRANDKKSSTGMRGHSVEVVTTTGLVGFLVATTAASEARVAFVVTRLRRLGLLAFRGVGLLTTPVVCVDNPDGPAVGTTVVTEATVTGAAVGVVKVGRRNSETDGRVSLLPNFLPLPFFL